MPFSEVSNALFITYLATEYSIASSSKNGFSIKSFLRSRPNQLGLVLVLLINLFDRLVSEAAWFLFLNSILESLLHTPKIILAAVLYMTVLYVDCARHVGSTSPMYAVTTTAATTTSSANTADTIKFLSPRRFLNRVGVEFLKILPVYPFLAVLISFGFMFVISFCEQFHLPLDWLNWPIYYGTLYGPFSLVYLKVKSKIVEEELYFLPQMSTTWNNGMHIRTGGGATGSTGSGSGPVRDLRNL